MIEYSDCFSKFVIIQGRTSNFTIVNSTTCSNFVECSQKLCHMANNSMVDMVNLFFESSYTEQIYYYDSKIVYLLASLIILLLLILFILTGLLCVYRLKLTDMHGKAYEKINKVHLVGYNETELQQ